MSEYIAHKTEYNTQTVKEHSLNVAELASSIAVPELKEIAYVAGLYHDIGKYQPSFQKRINGEEIKVEHSICGAKEVNLSNRIKSPFVKSLIEYVIAGHHSGIPDGGSSIDDPHNTYTLQGRLKRDTEDYSVYETELPSPTIDEETLIKWVCEKAGNDQGKIVDLFAFLTRYIFSCVTDADSIDTATFCDGERPNPLEADFESCLAKVNTYLGSKEAITPLQQVRSRIQKQVFDKIDEDADIYIMNMPTGSGKTLCSIKFALERAIKENKERIIYVIPYNNIIEQTADEFEKIFGDSAEVLRHYSSYSLENTDMSEDEMLRHSSAIENWDAKIIVATAVQFFESLYGNKRSKLRKVHNMANSIIVFDEIHIMPVEYLKPCIQAISVFTTAFNSEAILLSATMPDYSTLFSEVGIGNPTMLDLIQDRSDFYIFDKCRFSDLGEITVSDLLSEVSKSDSGLIVVNTKKEARAIYEECSGKKYHLSTYMTPKDRRRVIEAIRSDLADVKKRRSAGETISDEDKITVVSTSLIEAGVDLDFNAVFREYSGLDNLIQSAGRCNREGELPYGNVYTFGLIDGYKRRSAEENIFKGLLSSERNVFSTDCIEEYYRKLFAFDEFKMSDTIASAVKSDIRSLKSIPYREYANKFQFIKDGNIGVMVPIDEKSENLTRLILDVGIVKGKEIQEYLVQVNRYELDDLISQGAVSDNGTGTYCLVSPSYYEPDVGIRFEGQDYFL